MTFLYFDENGAEFVKNTIDYPEWTDVTEVVKTIFDAIVHSIDWGSGFLSLDECKAVVRLAKLVGVDPEEYEHIRDYVESQVHSYETRRWQERHESDFYEYYTHEPSGLSSRRLRFAHDHVFSSVGKCMWPGCRERKED